MAAKTYRGIVQGGQVVLDEGVTLPDGTPVTVIAQPPQRGTAAAVLAAIEAGPAIPPEDVDELERIVRGERPPAPVEIFGEERGKESLADPDAGLNLRKSVRDQLLAQKQQVGAGQRGRPLDEVVQEIGISAQHRRQRES